MNKKISYLPFLIVFLSMSVKASQAADCDPVVKLGQQVVTMQQALTVLAKRYNFGLDFAINADQSVESVEGMRLSKALKYLTSDVNTVLKYEKVEGCEHARLVSMEVLPVGEDTEYVYVKPVTVAQQTGPRKEKQEKKEKKNKASEKLKEKSDVKRQSEAGSLNEMDLYAEEVLLGKRRRDVNMTPEQLIEFRKAKRKARMRLEAEGRLEPRNARRKGLVPKQNMDSKKQEVIGKSKL